MNETILDLAERVAIAAYEKEVGTVNAAEANRLRNNLLARVDLSKSRRPITDALNAAHMAAVATKGAMHPQPHRDSQGGHTPVADKFSDTIDEVATERAAHYFSRSRPVFSGYATPASHGKPGQRRDMFHSRHRRPKRLVPRRRRESTKPSNYWQLGGTQKSPGMFTKP